VCGYSSVWGHNLLPKIGNSCEINFVLIHLKFDVPSSLHIAQIVRY
jgi:hypothetical protein